MSKKKMIMIGIGILILFILNVIIIVKNIYVPDNYMSSLTTEDQKEVVKDILSNVSFSKEIKNEIPAKKVYNEFTSLNNYEYPKKIYQYMEIANQKLEKQDSSFVKTYNENHSFGEILYEFCGDDYEAFSNAYLIGDEDNKEFPKESVQSTYICLLNKISDEKYDSVSEELNTLLEKYKFTESYNYKLANLYHDIEILNSETNLEDTEVLDNIYDSGVYTILTMKLFTEDRYKMIEDKNSPALYASTVINVKDVSTKEVYPTNKNYKNLYEKMYKFYTNGLEDSSYKIDITKITFTVDDEEFYAYLATLPGHVCKFYKIDAVEKKEYKSLYNANIEISNSQSENTDEIDTTQDEVIRVPKIYTEESEDTE